MILGIEIVNYDVFDDDKVGLMLDDSIYEVSHPEALGKHRRLRNLNALIGRNNTGKSRFFDALSFLQDTIVRDASIAATENGRPGFSNLVMDKEQPAIFRVFFKLENDGRSRYVQYNLAIKAHSYGSPIIYAEQILVSNKVDGTSVDVVTCLDMVEGKGTIDGQEVTIPDNHATALGVFGKVSQYKEVSALYREISTWFFCKFSTDEVSTYYADGNAPGGHKHLNSTGSNIGNVLEYISNEDPDYYNAMVDEIWAKIPQMSKKKVLPENLKSSPDRLLLYMVLLRDKEPYSTIFIETPDKDLYHDMVDVLSQDMRDFSINNKYSQIVFSTHNPYIIEGMNPKEIWVFTRNFELEDADVRVKCAGDNPLVQELFEQGVGMGAIWYAGHLDEDEEDDD